MLGDRRDQHCVASQAVGPHDGCVAVAEKPANGGLLQFGRRSPDAQFADLGNKIVKSLCPFIELFPFSGDGDRRLGSIYTARQVGQCHFGAGAACAMADLGRSLPKILAGSA